MRIGCRSDIINKEGGPLIAAILLRELNQAPSVESENKCIALLNFRVVFEVCCALYFNFYVGLVYFRSEEEIFGVCLNTGERICVFVCFFLTLNKALSPAQTSQNGIQILQELYSVCKLHCWTHHFKNSHMKKNV